MTTGLMSNMPRVAFLVFGCPKSGTTWVQRMLCAHPEVHCSESRAFGDFYNPNNPTQPHLSIEKYVGFMRWYHHGPTNNADGDAGRLFYQCLLHNIVNTIARVTLEHAGHGKRVYGEKATAPSVPGACRSIIDGWHSYNPDLCFIHLVRDPRDVAVSGLVQQYRDRIQRAGGRGDGNEAARLAEVIERQALPQAELEGWVSLWKEAVEHGERARRDVFPSRSFVLRYEDLLVQPEQWFHRVLELIGVDVSDELTSECVRAGSFEMLSGGRARGCEDRSSFFRKGVAGDWRNWLTDDQRAWCAQEAGDVMTRFGYAFA